MADFPYDREHVMVDVSFPVSRMGQKDGLNGAVAAMAMQFGGSPNMTSCPTPEFLGRPGYETFGASYAFERGDSNIGGFIARVQANYGHLGATVQHDPEDVLQPDEGEPSAGMRR